MPVAATQQRVAKHADGTSTPPNESSLEGTASLRNLPTDASRIDSSSSFNVLFYPNMETSSKSCMRILHHIQGPVQPCGLRGLPEWRPTAGLLKSCRGPQQKLWLEHFLSKHGGDICRLKDAKFKLDRGFRLTTVFATGRTARHEEVQLF
jgi:hypothetical protein